MEMLQADYTDITTSSNQKTSSHCIMKLIVLLESIEKFNKVHS